MRAPSNLRELVRVEALLWLVIIVSLALAVVSRKHRIYGLVLFGAAVVAIVAVIVIARQNEPATPPTPRVPTSPSKRVDFEQFHIDNSDRADPQAKNRIAVGQIRIDQIRPDPQAESGTLEFVTARLHNDSTRFALTDYEYRLTVMDCVDMNCTTVYDQRGRAAAMVPANEARDVKIALRSATTGDERSVALQGRPRISLSVTATRAYATN